MVFKVLKVIKVKIKPKIESHIVKKIIYIKNKSTIGWFVIKEIILAKSNKAKYKTSTKKIPSTKESEKAIPNQLLKKIKKEKYKITTKFCVMYNKKKFNIFKFSGQ